MSEESSANSLSKVGVTVYRDERRLFLLRTVSFYMKSGEFGWKFKLICATSLGLFLLVYLMDLWSSGQDLLLPSTRGNSDTVMHDFVPEGDYVSQAVGLGPTTLWNRVLCVSARETSDIGPQC